MYQKIGKLFLFSLLLVFVTKANAMDINAEDAQAEMGQTTMTLKRVHSGGSDYIFHMSWNSADNSWETVSYEPDYGYYWRFEANMLTGTYWAGSAVSGNKLYVVGGTYTWDKIAIYNSLTNTWTNSTVGNMGFLVRAAVLSGEIYIFESNPLSPGPGWIYNLQTKTLSPMTDTPPDLGWTSEPAVYNGKIYLFGGYSYGGSVPLNTTWEFDPATQIYTQKADMPTAGYGSSTAVLNGKIYVIGGNYRSNKIEIYNPKTNRWASTLSYPALSLFGWDSAAPLSSIIVIADAEDGSTFVFDPVAKTLTVQESMPRLHGDYLTGEGLGGRLYVAGGMSGPRFLDSFKPEPAVAGATLSPQSEAELLEASEPDYKAIEEMHLRQMEQVQQETSER